MSIQDQMRDFFLLLFSGAGYMPRLQCGTWTTGMLRFYIAADLTIAAAYFAIPICIWWAYKRYGRSAPLPFEAKILCTLFGVFIVACGCTHMVDSLIFLIPLYRLQTLVLSITALCSVMTAAVAPSMIHKLGTAQQTVEEQQARINQYRADVATLNHKLRVAERFVEEYLRKHPDSGAGDGGNITGEGAQ